MLSRLLLLLSHSLLLYSCPTQLPYLLQTRYSPPLVALLLSRLSGDKMSWRWPFAKDRIFGAFGLFLGLGWLCCVVPVFHTCTMLFAL